jgi:hypothetical protein
MALIREIPSMFHFWEHQIVQDVIDNGWVDRINPVSGFEGKSGGILKFFFPGNESFIYLPKSYLYLKLRLVGTGKVTDDGASVETTVLKSNFAKSGLSVVNNIAHSIFRSIEVKLGGQVITLGNSDYAYRTYLQLLCNTTKEAQDTYFTVVGWKKDKAGAMEGPTNPALDYRRSNYFTDDGVGEFIIRPHTAISWCQKAILPFNDCEITFNKHSTPSFFIKAKEDQMSSTPFDIEIVNAYYEVQRYRGTVQFVSELEMMLKDHPVIYNLKDSHVNTFTIPANVSNYSNDSLFHGTVPRRIVIAFVKTTNYNGKYTGNPFNFEHFNIESLRMLKNGLEYPVKETLTNFQSTPKTFMQAYHRMMMSIGADYNDHVVSVTPEEYSNGYFFYSFLMAPDQEAGSDVNNIASRPTQIKIEVRFAQNLTESVQMIVYSETETVVSVDMSRRVVVAHK